MIAELQMLVAFVFGVLSGVSSMIGSNLLLVMLSSLSLLALLVRMMIVVRSNSKSKE